MKTEIEALRDPAARLVILTGAGISAESGLSTFRGNGGLWDGWPVEEVATPEAFERDPALVWRFYGERRRTAMDAEPNEAHRAVAAAERTMGERFLLVTQNIDGLHEAAGSRRVLPIHGSLWTTRCTGCGRRRPDRELHATLPVCERCGALERPDIVWFGERLDPAHLERLQAFLLRADDDHVPSVFLAIGTSGVVQPAASFVRFARACGAAAWLNDLDGTAENAPLFEHVVPGPATRVVPALLAPVG